MKARLVPVYFDPGRDGEFDVQIGRLKQLLGDQAELLAPVALGQPLPEADAVVFPQILGEAYRSVEAFRAIRLPILIVTSAYGTMSMWDWEIIDFLRSKGVPTLAPYNLEQARSICRALATRKALRQATFLVFQDNPGEGMQPSIFKRFFWWEEECTRRMEEQFGIRIVRQSFKELAAEAAAVSDREAIETWRNWSSWQVGEVAGRPLNSAVKVYIALCRRVAKDPSIRAIGINCLNESAFSDTTPCLAFNMLQESHGIIWGCEADTVSMATLLLMNASLHTPLMMTNLYPFLMGDAALKHERIAAFPTVAERPEDHILVAHCGYFGLLPRGFATDWALRPKVLGIVDDNATAIDARLPVGPVTMVKLRSSLDRIHVTEASLEGYAQFPGSDCRNGGVIRVRDGHRMMKTLASHHYILLPSHRAAEIDMIAPIFGLTVDTL